MNPKHFASQTLSTLDCSFPHEAIHLLGVYTANRFDLWMLAGSSKASCRAHLMSALQGTRVPQSKSGITAIRNAFYSLLNIAGECEAHREELFRAVCKEAQEDVVIATGDLRDGLMSNSDADYRDRD